MFVHNFGHSLLMWVTPQFINLSLVSCCNPVYEVCFLATLMGGNLFCFCFIITSLMKQVGILHFSFIKNIPVNWPAMFHGRKIVNSIDQEFSTYSIRVHVMAADHRNLVILLWSFLNISYAPWRTYPIFP